MDWDGSAQLVRRSWIRTLISGTWLVAVLLADRVAVKLLWKLWSRKDVSKLQKTTRYSETLSRSVQLDCDCKCFCINLLLWDNSKCLLKLLFWQYVVSRWNLRVPSALVVVSFGGISCSFDTSFHRLKFENWQEDLVRGRLHVWERETLSFLRFLKALPRHLFRNF